MENAAPTGNLAEQLGLPAGSEKEIMETIGMIFGLPMILEAEQEAKEDDPEA